MNTWKQARALLTAAQIECVENHPMYPGIEALSYETSTGAVQVSFGEGMSFRVEPDGAVEPIEDPRALYVTMKG